MADIRDYKVISASNEAQLDHRVKQYIEKGFEPFGGVSVCVIKAYTKDQYTFAQAVVDYHDA